MEVSGDDGFMLQVPGTVRGKGCSDDAVFPKERHLRKIDQRSLVDAAIEAVI